MAPTSTERQNTPDSGQNVPKMVGKSVEEVKRHYEILKKDIERIERGQVPFPCFHNRTAVTPKSIVNKQSRL